MPKSETQISKECGDFLSLNHIPNWRTGVYHGKFTPFGSKKSRVIKTGVAGLSDRQFLMPDGKTAYLEIKTEKGKQSQEQRDFETTCIKWNAPYFIVRSVNDLAEILQELNMLKVRF